MSWERRISHSGLNAFRVIRGPDRDVVNIKAELQLKLWEEKWQKLQNVKAVAVDKEQKKRIAETKTLEAQEQLSGIAKTLCRSLSKDHRVDWDELKDHSQFPDAPPLKLNPTTLLRRPLREDLSFQPQLGFLDQLIRSWREKKIEACQRRYLAAEAQWKRDVAAMEHWKISKAGFEEQQSLANAIIDKKKSEYFDQVPERIIEYCNMVLERSEYPDNFPRSCLLEYLAESKTLIAEYDLPSVTALPTVKEVKYVATKDIFTETHVTPVWLNRLYDDLIYQIALGTINELFQADSAQALEVVVFNGWVSSVDRATGNMVNPCIVSIQVSKAEFKQINLALVEPRACFKKLKGISASTLAEMTPVRPVMQIKREDKRFIDAYSVADSLDASSNLAAMDWEDFENLIREVFEKEFSKNGGEVKITRASRDGGVDAVAFDPDPIRGGKIVIQAKRYTNTVSVSAVRDLYGTLMNEGANKGILVTTADYGPDAYEFAKDKPLTLLNGNELLYLLAQHGHRAKINLVEARKLLGEKER
jgi:restriction system protein